MSNITVMAEDAFRGAVVPVSSFEEVNLIAEYLYQQIYDKEKTFDFKERVNKYNSADKENEIVGVAVSCFDDMYILNCILKNDTEDEEYRIVPYEFDNGDFCYSFCWAENLTVDYFSELGDVAFKKTGDNSYILY